MFNMAFFTTLHFVIVNPNTTSFDSSGCSYVVYDVIYSQEKSIEGLVFGSKKVRLIGFGVN